MNTTRYDRQIKLSEIGSAGQLRIQNAKVLVVGAGGLGCPVLQYLVAAGVGEIGIVDNDIVEESNIQRQVIYGTDSIGKSKAESAGKYLENLNPEIKTIIYNFRLTQTNIDIIKKYDIIIDCTDNFETRYILNDACLQLNKPWIYGAVHKYEGQVSVFNYQGGPSYRDLFPNKSEADIPDCATVGVLGVLPGITGMLQATECIKMITGIGDILSGKLLVFDMLKNQFNTYNFTHQYERT